MLLDTDGILAVSTSVGVFLCCLLTVLSAIVRDGGCSRRQCRRNCPCRCGRQRAETDEDLVSTSGAVKVWVQEQRVDSVSHAQPS